MSSFCSDETVPDYVLVPAADELKEGGLKVKKVALVFALILICVLLTGCGSIVNQMGDRFVEIESDGNIALCYCRDTMAVYIIYDGPYRFGVSPYIMFDEFNQATVGKWNGKEIVPAMLEFDETYTVMGKGQ